MTPVCPRVYDGHMANAKDLDVRVRLAVEVDHSTVHQCPHEGEAVTPCCGRTPFELLQTDRLSVDVRQVTCGKPDVSVAAS